MIECKFCGHQHHVNLKGLKDCRNCDKPLDRANKRFKPGDWVIDNAGTIGTIDQINKQNEAALVIASESKKGERLKQKAAWVYLRYLDHAPLFVDEEALKQNLIDMALIAGNKQMFLELTGGAEVE
ncbi:hypothetical protein CPT_Silence56 [Bacillus phage Silence]|nr:hypothetical protein CPT_Silence56 [Bacillus phage Silence]